MILLGLLLEVLVIMWFINKRILIGGAILILIALMVGSCFYFYNKGIKDSTVPVQNIASVSRDNIRDAQLNMHKYRGEGDVKEVTHLIEKAKTKPADIQYTARTQEEADRKANTLAKKDKADYLLKETNNDNNTIHNNYYSIHQEKRNRIGAGVAIINNDIYGTVHYQRDRLRVEAFKSITNPKGKSLDGAAVSYDFVKF